MESYRMCFYVADFFGSSYFQEIDSFIKYKIISFILIAK